MDFGSEKSSLSNINVAFEAAYSELTTNLESLIIEPSKVY